MSLSNGAGAFTWGWTEDGRCGLGQNLRGTIQNIFPSPIERFGETSARPFCCAAGQRHSLFVLPIGSLWACGAGIYGELGRDLEDDNDDIIENITAILPNIVSTHASNKPNQCNSLNVATKYTRRCAYSPTKVLFGKHACVESIAAGDCTSLQSYRADFSFELCVYVF